MEALSPHVRVFVYEGRQEEVAGTDGMEVFREVFLHESTLNVILYRDGYGGTSWTRVERDAIQQKALNDGWHTLLLIGLEAGAKGPIWLPSQRITSLLTDSGIAGIVGVILARAREAGAPDRGETPAELAARLDRKYLDQKRRGQLEQSEAGVGMVLEEIQSIFGRIKTAVDKIAAQNPNRRAKSGHSPIRLVAVIGTASVAATWEPTYTNSLNGAALVVQTFDTPIPIPGEPPARFREPIEAGHRILVPSLEAGDQWVWTDRETRDAFSSDRLADFLVSDTVRRSYNLR
jgi:hypothetical protein